MGEFKIGVFYVEGIEIVKFLGRNEFLYIGDFENLSFFKSCL